MATRIRARASDLYQQDLYAWSKEQVGLLRARRFAELDLEHMIEEIEDVGGALRRSARKRIRSIVEHLLKLEHSPATELRAGWRATVRTQRVRLRDTLTPALHREIADAMPELYRDARASPKARSATTASMPPQTRSRWLSLQPRPDHLRLAADLEAGRLVPGERCIKLCQARALPQILTLCGRR